MSLPLLIVALAISASTQQDIKACDVGDIKFSGINPAELVGTWYDLQGTEYTTKYKCSTTQLSLESPTTLSEESTFYIIEDEEYASETGQIFNFTSNSFLYQVHGVVKFHTTDSGTPKYYVLGLDPEKYLVLTICQNNKLNTYVIGRGLSLDPSSEEAVKKILQQNNRDVNELKPFQQQDCPAL